MQKNSLGLVIRDSQNINKVEIYDAAGKLVLSKGYNAENVNINTTSFAKGFYIVKVIQKTGIKTKKVIL